MKSRIVPMHSGNAIAGANRYKLHFAVLGDVEFIHRSRIGEVGRLGNHTLFSETEIEPA